ncbi:MAG TPA: hypothetical protein VJ742_12650 [Nitrososphaera sp.]|nr:hypothetical protein [Nitrososphaera sp.]
MPHGIRNDHAQSIKPVQVGLEYQEVADFFRQFYATVGDSVLMDFERYLAGERPKYSCGDHEMPVNPLFPVLKALRDGAIVAEQRYAYAREVGAKIRARVQREAVTTAP